MYRAGSNAFEDASDALPHGSIAADRLHEQSSNLFEFTYILREAILSIPAMSLADAAVQLAALKTELALESQMLDLSRREERRRELVLTAGIDSVGEILRSAAKKYERATVEVNFPALSMSMHAIDADEFEATLRRTLPAKSFGETPLPAEVA